MRVYLHLLFALLLGLTSTLAAESFSVTEGCPEWLVTEIDLDTTLCNGDFLVVGMTIFDNQNTAGQVLLEAASGDGTDSIVNVTLNFFPSAVSSFSAVVCASQDTIMIGDSTYQLSEPIPTEIYAGLAANGVCDSFIVVTDVTIIPDTLDLCDYLNGEPTMVDTTVYTGDIYACDTSRQPYCLGSTSTEVGFGGCITLYANGHSDIGALQGTIRYDGTALHGPSFRILEDGYSFFGPESEVAITDSTIRFLTANLTDPVVDYLDGTPLVELCFDSISVAGIYELTIDSIGSEIVFSNGSVSTINANLGVLTVICLPQPPVVTTQTICSGDSILFGDTVYTEAGQYQYLDTSIVSCPVLRILNLVDFEETLFLTCDVAICDGGMGMAAVSGFPSGTTFLWSNGDTTATLITDVPGTYTVTVSHENCTAMLTTNVFLRPLPEATVTGPTEVCFGETATLTATTGENLSYRWSNGATTPSITVSGNGTYFVEVTSVDGCSAISPVHSVTELPELDFSIIVDDATVCVGESTAVLISGNVSVVWPDGSTSVFREDIGAGAYELTITDNATGCTVTETLVITEDGEFEVVCPQDIEVIIYNVIGPNPTAVVFFDAPEVIATCLDEYTVETSMLSGGSVFAGETVVTVTVTNLRTGEVKTCSFTITAQLAGPLELFADTTYLDNGRFCTTVMVDNLEDNLAFLQYAVIVPAGLNVLTVVPSAFLEANYPEVDITWWYNPETGRLAILLEAPDGNPIVPMEDGTPLFTIKTEPVIPTQPGDCFELNVDPSFLAEAVYANGDYVTPAVLPLVQCLPREFPISGQVLRPAIFLNAHVPNVAMTLLDADGNVLMEVLTDVDGRFDFGLHPGDAGYRIRAELDENHAQFLSALDVWTWRQLATGALSLGGSNYVFTAADTYRDYFLALNDAHEIGKVIVGLQPTFSNSPSWRIDMEGDESLLEMTDDFATEYIIEALTEPVVLAMRAVKIGDLATSPAGNGVLPVGGAFELALEDGSVSQGEIFSLTIPVDASTIQLPFLVNGLELLAAELTNESNEDELTLWTQKQRFRLLYDAGNQRAHDGEQSIKLTFRSAVNAKVSEALKLNLRDGMMPEYVSKDGQFKAVDLVFVASGQGSPFGVTVYPNPVATVLNLKVEVSPEEGYTVAVTDGTGRTVLTSRRGRGAGTLTYDVAELPAGVYTVSVLTESGQFWSKRLVRQ